MSILQRNKKLTAGLGIAAVVVAVAAIGAGTYAAFSDTETGPGGTATAGTLDLEVGGSEAVELFKGDNIKPGFSQTSTLSIVNAGSLDGGLSGTVQLTSGDGPCTEPEAEAEKVARGACNKAGDLQDQMRVKVVRAPGLSGPGPELTVAELVKSGFPRPVTLPAGTKSEFELLFFLPSSADNTVQGDTLTIASTLTLNQL